MSAEERTDRVLENDDICAVRGEHGERNRYFVRCTLAVRLLDAPGATRWGLWAEVNEEDSNVIYHAWDDPEQDKLPPMHARIANRVAGYPDTIGLPVALRLISPKSRLQLSLSSDASHPFAKECLAGVCTHRVMEWLEGMRPSGRN
jgi:hypothetical protein